MPELTKKTGLDRLKELVTNPDVFEYVEDVYLSALDRAKPRPSVGTASVSVNKVEEIETLMFKDKGMSFDAALDKYAYSHGLGHVTEFNRISKHNDDVREAVALHHAVVNGANVDGPLSDIQNNRHYLEVMGIARDVTPTGHALHVTPKTPG